MGAVWNVEQSSSRYSCSAHTALEWNAGIGDTASGGGSYRGLVLEKDANYF